VPELAEKVYGASENTLAALNASPTPAAEPGAAPAQALVGVATKLATTDFQPLLVLYECKRGMNVLPVGWPWMATFAEHVDRTARNAKPNTAIDTSPTAQAEACGRALAHSDLSTEAVQRLSLLGIAYTPPAKIEAAPAAAPAAPPQTAVQPGAATPAPAEPAAPPPVDPAVEKAKADQQALLAKSYATQFQPVYGPDPARDPWIYVILGWLITTVAAAQGAPFWFDLLRKLVSRK
jgi:hypothetical protein